MMTLGDAHDKIASLLEAVPEDKLDWRPAEGVRSIREAMVHVAAANYFFGSMLGAQIPEGVDPRGMEANVTGKEAIGDAIEASFEHASQVVTGLSDDQLTSKAQWFDGSERDYRFILHFMSVHAHEHLGQLIAYARMNDITPPWSE